MRLRTRIFYTLASCGGWPWSRCLPCGLVPVFMLLGGPADLDAAEAGGWMAVVGWIVGLAAVSMASFAVHELVHAVFFKLLAPAGAQVTFGANRETAMIYACAEGVVYSRRRYMAVCLAPTVVVTTTLALGFAFSGYPLLCYLAAGLHLSGCVGDWYYVRTILRDRRIVACEDTSLACDFSQGSLFGMIFLGRGLKNHCRGGDADEAVAAARLLCAVLA